MFLVVDSGNEMIKLCFFDKKEMIFSYSTYNKEINLKEINLVLSKYEISKIAIGSVCWNKISVFYDYLIETYGENVVTKINSKDFADKMELSNFDLNEVGSDILALAYYVSRNYGSGVGCCFGTAHFAVRVENNKLLGATIAPAADASLKNLSDSTELINCVNNKIDFSVYFGKNTDEAISSGYYHVINGFILSISTSVSNAANKNIILTGGKTNMFSKYIKADNYRYIQNCISLGYWQLLKDKGIM